MTAGQVTLLCLLGLATVAKEVTTQQQCPVPQWPLPGENPLQLHAGKVLLVALMKGYCQYCWYQAHNLELLRNHLHSRGFPDIAMIIVNGGDTLSRDHIGNYAQYTNLTVYQDTENHTLYNLFDGSKDDFIVFNRCGQRVIRIDRRFSYLGRSTTEIILRRVHRGQARACPCSLDPQRRRGRRSAGNWRKATLNN